MFALITLAFILIALVLYEIHLENQFQVVNNSTFVGEVINKESTTRSAGVGIWNQHTTHRLHIVGEYIEDGVVVHVDRVFIVSRYWYDRFEIGDLICHPYPPYVTEVELTEGVGHVSFNFNRRRNYSCLS